MRCWRVAFPSEFEARNMRELRLFGMPVEDDDYVDEERSFDVEDPEPILERAGVHWTVDAWGWVVHDDGPYDIKRP